VQQMSSSEPLRLGPGLTVLLLDIVDSFSVFLKRFGGKCDAVANAAEVHSLLYLLK